MSRSQSRGQGRYVRVTRVDPLTGATVQVVDLTHEDSPFPPGVLVEQRNFRGEPVRQRLQRWGSVCLEHGSCCPHERQEDARVSAEDPADWCSGCRETTQAATG